MFKRKLIPPSLLVFGLSLAACGAPDEALPDADEYGGAAGASGQSGSGGVQPAQDASPDGTPGDSGPITPGDASKDGGLLDSSDDANDASNDVNDASNDVNDASNDVNDASNDANDASNDVSDASNDVSDASNDVSDASNDVSDASNDVSGGNANVWMQIDYSHAHSPQSPSWDFSLTPGWGEKQWAYGTWDYPKAWDRFNNMVVGDDPMGSRALFISSSGQLQLMMGLATMKDYDHAVVRLEGRARDTSSSVKFTVSNPANGCSVDGQMSNDWTIHVVDLDFGKCLVPGESHQAVRVDPLYSTLALVRMRVTLYGASW